MPDGSTWEGDPKIWVIMQSKNFKKNYLSTPYYTGQGGFPTKYNYGNGLKNTDEVTRAPYFNGTMWFSDNSDYGESFANYYDRDGNALNDFGRSNKFRGKNFIAAIPKNGNYRVLNNNSSYPDDWKSLPYEKIGNNIVRLSKNRIKLNVDKNQRIDNKKVLTDDVVEWSRQLKDNGIFINKVDDGPAIVPSNKTPINKRVLVPKINQDSNPLKVEKYVPILNEFISHPGFTNKVKFIEGNNGDFDINDSYKYSMNINKPGLTSNYARINV